MSFLCNFPLNFSKDSPLETDTHLSISLPVRKKINMAKYSNDNEIKFNIEEQKKVIYVKKAETFDLNLQISGDSILQNLILTAKASHNGEPIPIKCQWRRVRTENERMNIKNINSFSYMPNAADIGFWIEVEVESLDDMNDIAIAKYGPIIVDNEIKNIITELLSYEKKCFNLKSCNEKLNNKNFILDLGKREIKLINFDQRGNKNILERCKYSQVNPSLELSNTNVTKFKISFIQFNNSNDNINYNESANNSDNISLFTEVENEDIYESELKIKNEYEFFAMSKQCRELIYIIIQYNAINIKIRNNKIFRASNYNNLSPEIKNGIVKLIGDLKIHKEQNTIMLKNIKYLEYVNKQLNEEYSTLEDNYKITMDKINGRDPHYRAMSNGIKYQDYLSNNNNNNNNNLDEDEWKNKYNELKTNYNTLLAKEKAIDEEKLLLVNKDNKNLKSIEKNNKEIADIKNKNSIYEKELESYKKNLSIINDDKIKIKNNCDDLEKEIKSLKEKNNLLLSKMNNNSNNNNEKIKMEINEIKKNNENLNYENKNLIMQKNMLTNQKNDLVKEIEKIKKEKENLIKDINSIKSQKNNNSNNKKKDNKIIEELKKQNDDLENEYNKIKDNYQYLVLENINLKEMYEKTNKNQNKVNMSTISANTSMMGYQISPEEYEEYDNLRKNKDENEALILQLKSNNQAKEVEKQELKEILKNLTGKK